MSQFHSTVLDSFATWLHGQVNMVACGYHLALQILHATLQNYISTQTRQHGSSVSHHNDMHFRVAILVGRRLCGQAVKALDYGARDGGSNPINCQLGTDFLQHFWFLKFKMLQIAFCPPGNFKIASQAGL